MGAHQFEQGFYECVFACALSAHENDGHLR